MDAAETEQAPNMKSVFLPLAHEREGWTPARSRLLLRFAPSNNVDVDPTIRCQCGASRAWTGADDPALPRWVGEHGHHMPALPHEPPERGVLWEQDDDDTDSMKPAQRWPDGRIEVVEQTFDEPPPSSSDCLGEELWAQFHEARFSDIWYAHPGPHPYMDYQQGGKRERFGPRWHAGVFTGPQHDLICVKPCETNEEAERFLSPGGWSPEEAVRLALQKREALGVDE